jgi:hypothetical protein
MRISIVKVRSMEVPLSYSVQKIITFISNLVGT